MRTALHSEYRIVLVNGLGVCMLNTKDKMSEILVHALT